MKERPILFSGTMVKAIAEGKKTQTRRVIGHDFTICDNLPGYDWYIRNRRGLWENYTTQKLIERYCPYGNPGDTLWVRETWTALFDNDDGLTLWWHNTPKEQRTQDRLVARVIYRAEYKPEPNDECPFVPSIFMPRWASRLSLEVVRVRVERLQEISEDDAKAEGVEPFNSPVLGQLYKPSFCSLWNEINGKRPGRDWQSNPWCWVIEFRSTGKAA